MLKMLKTLFDDLFVSQRIDFVFMHFLNIDEYINFYS